MEERPKPHSQGDYFIKDGKWIGNFEGMYADLEDPWGIETDGAKGGRLDYLIAMSLLKYHSNHHPEKEIKDIIDFGAGMGWFANEIKNMFPDANYIATDVSETACWNGKKRYPKIDSFIPFDVNVIDEKASFPLASGYDLIVFSQVLWMVIPSLERVLKELRRILRPDGIILISQHFFQPGQQKYGVEVISKPDDLFRFVREAGFQVNDIVEINRHINHHVAFIANPC